MTTMKKHNYLVANGVAEGKGARRDLLREKGVGLAKMTALGMRIPPGCPIPIGAYRTNYHTGNHYPPALWDEFLRPLQKSEPNVGAMFGDRRRPLLLSVRSGAHESIPSMMDTVLRIDLHDIRTVALHVKLDHIHQLLHPMIDPQAKILVLTRGLSDSPSAASRCVETSPRQNLPQPRTQEDWQTDTTCYMLHVPYFPQETNDTCAPACLRMALAFRFCPAIVETTLAYACDCLEGLGSLVGKVYDVAASHGLPVQWLKNCKIEAQVQESLQRGSPVLANIQLRLLYPPVVWLPQEAWHSVIIMGMDNRYVYLHDPDPLRGGPSQRRERSKFFADWLKYPYSAYRL